MLQISDTVTPQKAYNANNPLGAAQEVAAQSEDITRLVDMFCCLFDRKRAGLRLATLVLAKYSRFHVDQYHFENKSLLHAMTVVLGELFPGIRKIHVMRVKQKQQGAVTLTPNNRMIKFRSTS